MWLLHYMYLQLLVAFTLLLIPPVACPAMDCPLTFFANERDMLAAYLLSGYAYGTILTFIGVYHGYQWSMATLKRKLKSYHLGHRLDRDTIQAVDAAILDELQGPRANIGYRTMWRVLRQNHNLSVSRKTVMQRLRYLDPEGTHDRKMRKLQRRSYYCPGPNFNWHSDGYDKLKKWGFCVHGAIDGYSRKLLWLEVASTNNNPGVIAGYYLNTVSRLSLCPNKLITDCGTEMDGWQL